MRVMYDTGIITIPGLKFTRLVDRVAPQRAAIYSMLNIR